MGITLRIEQFDPERPVGMDALVWDHFRNWYENYCEQFGQCPTITDLIESYIEIVAEMRREAILELGDAAVRSRLERSTAYSLDEMAYDEAVLEVYGTLGTIEEIISDLHICAGFTFEIDRITEGFVLDLDMASSSALTGKKYLGPQIPLFRFLESSGDAYVRPEFIFSVAEHIEGRRRRAFL